jgi:phosphoglycerol transferase MdoB-like AlkP superfamily enzyme
MKRLLAFFVYWVYWILFFQVARFVFFLFNLNDQGNSGMALLLRSAVHGFKLDLSVATYLSVIPFIIFLFSFCLDRKLYFSKFLNIYHLIILGILCLIVVADAKLYTYWGYKLNDSVLVYLKNPSGATASVSGLEVLIIFLVVAALFYFFYLIWKRIFVLFKHWMDKSWPAFAAGLLLLGMSIIPVRGGIGNVPLSISDAYFSSVPFANHMAVNTVWNLGYALTGKEIDFDKYKLIGEKEANDLFAAYKGDESNRAISKTGRPNVIMIVLESFTAGAVESFGGVKGLTPNLDALMKQSVSFIRCFSSGDRSEKGLASLFTGFPSLPKGSILEYPEKAAALPNILSDFKKAGYRTGFTCGSDLSFANVRSLLYNGGIDVIKEKKDYKKAYPESKWGYHDSYVFGEMLEDLKTVAQPFFYTVYTISSHDPFKVPVTSGYSGVNGDFFNAIRYTDSCLGVFILGLKNQKLWENVILMITADHGIRRPNFCAVNDPEKFHIPLLIGGGYMDTAFVDSSPCSHTDIPYTLLGLANIESKSDYPFSRNLMNAQADPYALIYYNEGTGFIGRSDTVIYDIKMEQFIKGKEGSRDSQRKMFAYLYKLTEAME